MRGISVDGSGPKCRGRRGGSRSAPLRAAGLTVLLALLAAPVAAQPYLYILSSGYTCSGRGCDPSRIADARVVVLDARTHQKVSTITLPVTGAPASGQNR